MGIKGDQYLARQTGHVNMVWSLRAKTTISSTRYDTDARGINSILFLSNGNLKSVTNSYMTGVLDSHDTIESGTRLYLHNASKVQFTSKGLMLAYLNS